jgi:site-specific recombinase XerD
VTENFVFSVTEPIIHPPLPAGRRQCGEGTRPHSWNKHLSALTSFTAYCGRQDWLATDPGRRLERRKVTRTRDKAIPRARLERLFTDDRNPLRERVLWRMLYETCARAEEILGLDVPDLDMEFRRALVVEKGGDRAYVHWETPTARLLPRLLAGRTVGPVFLADRRTAAAGRRAPALGDICPETGRGRLSYPRAEYLFKQASQLHDPHGAGYTLHQLRHSGLTHLAAKGRSAAELQAKSRHRHLATPRHLRSARRGDLRPHHCRERRAPPSAPPLISRPTYRDQGKRPRAAARKPQLEERPQVRT